MTAPMKLIVLTIVVFLFTACNPPTIIQDVHESYEEYERTPILTNQEVFIESVVALDILIPDDEILPTGYNLCDGMRNMRDAGATLDDYLSILTEMSIDEGWTDEFYVDMVLLSGAAAGSICDDLFEWGQE